MMHLCRMTSRLPHSACSALSAWTLIVIVIIDHHHHDYGDIHDDYDDDNLFSYSLGLDSDHDHGHDNSEESDGWIDWTRWFGWIR